MNWPRSHPLLASGLAQGSGAVLTQFAADWFHPDDRGQRLWADAFWAQIVRGCAPGEIGPGCGTFDPPPRGSAAAQ